MPVAVNCSVNETSARPLYRADLVLPLLNTSEKKNGIIEPYTSFANFFQHRPTFFLLHTATPATPWRFPSPPATATSTCSPSASKRPATFVHLQPSFLPHSDQRRPFLPSFDFCCNLLRFCLSTSDFTSNRLSYRRFHFEHSNVSVFHNMVVRLNNKSADVKKQTVFFLQTADVWSTSSAAEVCRYGPQTADVLASKKQTAPIRRSEKEEEIVQPRSILTKS
ncbi:hypothetical protein LXL04_028196 [Taraxacum kok-saghyz]